MGGSPSTSADDAGTDESDSDEEDPAESGVQVVTTNATCWGTAQRHLETTPDVAVRVFQETKHADGQACADAASWAASQGYKLVANTE